MTNIAIKRILSEIINDNHSGFKEKTEKIKSRELEIHSIKNKIQIIIGVRRAGKTSLLYQRQRELVDNGVKLENIVEINFFDERLTALRADNLGLISEAYYEQFPEKKENEKVYFFFDELQEINAWELFVERLQRTENSEIYITGSSAKLLSKEIASQMGGRSLSYELFPLSFAEYLKFGNVDYKKQSSKTRLIIQREFLCYLQEGGFPEVYKLTKNIRIKILHEYYNAIVNRDVILRHNVRNPRAVSELANRLIASNASLYTTNRLFEFLKQQSYKLSKEFVNDCLDWLEDAYLFFSVYLYDTSLNKRLVNPRKIYCIDTALVEALKIDLMDNKGRLLENVVFLHVRSQENEVFYYKTKTGKEVDFYYVNKKGEKNLIQVALNLEDKVTKKREIESLLEAMKEQKIKKAKVITLENEDEIKEEGYTINVLPAWRYLLG